MELNVKWPAIFGACLSAASILTAQTFQISEEQSHIQILSNQATQTANALAEKVNEVSGGGMNFLMFGTKGQDLVRAVGTLSALGIPVNNPNEPEDFISRLAGNTQSEESVSWCGTNALVGFNDSGSFVKTLITPVSPSGSFSFDGWSRSTNAGATFTDRGILVADPPGFPLPAGIRFRDLFGDPVLGCSSSSLFYYVSLATDTMTSGAVFSGISVSKSTDGGATFQGAIMAISKSATTHMLDKPWMALEGTTMHITYTDFFSTDPRCPGGTGSSIEYVRSTDGGLTWNAPVVIDTACGTSPLVQGSQVAVGPAGSRTVYIAWESFPNGFGTGRNIRLRKSIDGGGTFLPLTVVASVTAIGDGQRVQGLFRTFIDLQGLTVDRSSNPATRGNVYIVWHDGRNKNQSDPFASPGCLPGRYCFGDVLLSRSTTAGSSWTVPFVVNNDALSLVDRLFPAVAVDNLGRIRVVFYDRRRDNRNFLIDTFVGTSEDAGASWTNDRVTPRNFPAIHAQDMVVNPSYMGDYLGIAADTLATHPGVIAAWGDNTRGDPNVVAAKRVP
jgi:hypothetical protein